jgi:hypothetical protein
MKAGFIRTIAIVLVWLAPYCALAQTAPSTGAPLQPLLKAEQLDQLVAPIALYPDPLLAQLLIAATYPLEVVQAERWAKANAKLKGDALTAAIGKQPWDESIKSLVPVPNVLTMMSDQLEWTQRLGDAMLAQQSDVMEAVQRLRARAQANGKLQSSKEQTVTTQTDDQQRPYVVIEPASPNEIYVPYYEPAVVYGAWPYPDYAPYYFPPPPGYIPGRLLATGIAFGAGIAVGHAILGNCDWGRRNINVVANRPVNINNVNRGDLKYSKWEHNADHRHGVRYNNAEVRQKYAKTDIQAGKAARQDFRGKEGQQVLDPNRGRPGSADRPNVGDRQPPSTRPAPGMGATPKGPVKADRPGPATKQAAKPKAPSQATRPAPQPKRDTSFSHVQPGKATRAQADRGRQSYHGGGQRPAAAARGSRPAPSAGGRGGRGGRR